MTNQSVQHDQQRQRTEKILAAMLQRAEKVMSPDIPWSERSEEIGIFMRRGPEDQKNLIEYVMSLLAHVDDRNRKIAELRAEIRMLKEQSGVVGGALKSKTPPEMMITSLGPGTGDLPKVGSGDLPRVRAQHTFEEIENEVSSLHPALEINRSPVKDPRREVGR